MQAYRHTCVTRHVHRHANVFMYGILDMCECVSTQDYSLLASCVPVCMWASSHIDNEAKVLFPCPTFLVSLLVLASAATFTL